MSDYTKHNGAIIHLPEEEIESEVFVYLDDMQESPLFELDLVSIMPDVHVEPNSRTLIGFTMPFRGKMSPEIIGPDAGCGVMAVKLDGWEHTEEEYDSILEDVEQKVPLSKGQYSAPKRTREDSYHMAEDFPYTDLTERLKESTEIFDDVPEVIQNFLDNGGYSFEWVKNTLVPRTGIDIQKLISGVGTLGGGNHFIEISTDSTGDHWLVVHVGSRHVGHQIFNYHNYVAEREQYANEVRSLVNNLPEEYKQYLKVDLNEETDDDVYKWVTGGKGESYYDKQQIKENYTGEKIEEVITSFPRDRDIDTGLTWNYLTGDNVYKYYIDMLFAQAYAEENRQKIAKDVIKCTSAEIIHDTKIDSPHNLIDFNDGMIRKGATRASKGVKGIIPFNMEKGAIIFKGKGNEKYNNSVSHGAGRPRNRGDSIEQFKMSETLEKPQIKTTSSDPGEYPHAYKNPEQIKRQITDTVTIEETLTPILNFKG